MLPTSIFTTLLPFLTLLLISTSLCAETRLSTAIKLGQKYLINNVIADNYGLQCAASTSQAMPVDCPYNGAGLPITSFFIAQALTRGNHLPDMVRDKLLSTLDRDEQRLDAFYWGDSNPVSWGYAHNAPPDSDDTSFALRARVLLGNVANPAGLTQFYDKRQNAYTTFKATTEAPPITSGAIAENSILQPPETNANVFALFQALHLPEKINFKLISAFQSTQGYWLSYFYPGKYYSTYMNMSVLCFAGKTHKKEIDLGLKFITSSQNRNGSWGKPGNAYETALAVNTLLACQRNKGMATKRGTDYLLKTQTKEGYWAHSQPIWEYSPNPAIRQIAYDDHYVLSSALALHALEQYKT